MQRLCRVLCVLAFLAPSAAQAGEVKVSIHVRGGWWLLPAALAAFEPLPFHVRYAPPVSPHHLSAAPRPATDSCTFVAGVRHCPLPKPPGAELR
jgi:hypothetical protein